MIEETVTKLQAAIDRTVEFLQFRSRAYKLCFPKQERFSRMVLTDLAMFSHYNEECPHTDPYEIGVWMGRQSMFLRLQRHLYLTPEELFAIYGGIRNKEK